MTQIHVRVARCRAFTLAELLVSVAILVVLVLLMARMMGATYDLWQQSESRLDAFREARAALHIISRDLGSVMGAPRPEDNEKVPFLSIRPIASQPGNNQQVYAVIPARNPGKSDLCGVGFFCAWDAAKKAYVLKRYFEDSDAFFTRLQGAGLPNSAATNPTAIFQPNTATLTEELGAYIWDLQIRPFESNSGNLTQKTPPVDYTDTAKLPAFIEIYFKAMSPTVARAVTAQNIQPADWTNPASAVYKNLIHPHAREFTTRIHLRSAKIESP